MRTQPPGLAPTVLPRGFYAREARALAPKLLGKVLYHGARSGRIVEVEAYERDDPASHAFRGPGRRNAVMFGPPGHLYVYFSYGVHWCANVVCDEDGRGAAVLVRALSPLQGIDVMFAARPAARRHRDLCSGPGRLTQALGLNGSHDGADLVGGDRDVWLLDDGEAAPSRSVVQTTRIGITKAADRPWRWYVDGDAHVSRRLARRPPAAPPHG